MCEMCEFAALGETAAVSRFSATGDAPASFAAPTNLEARLGAASDPPEGVGQKGRRTLIKGGVVVSMDDGVGNFAAGDVLIEGAKILQVAAAIDAPDAAVIDASGHIVLPGFIDTHHHQFETVLRGALADAILINDGRPESANNYYESVLLKLSQVYRPEDVYINELFGSISHIDAGVTATHDVSQIHHSPAHSDAAVDRPQGRRPARRARLFRGLGRGDQISRRRQAPRASNISPPAINC